MKVENLDRLLKMNEEVQKIDREIESFEWAMRKRDRDVEFMERPGLPERLKRRVLGAFRPERICRFRPDNTYKCRDKINLTGCDLQALIELRKERRRLLVDEIEKM